MNNKYFLSFALTKAFIEHGYDPKTDNCPSVINKRTNRFEYTTSYNQILDWFETKDIMIQINVPQAKSYSESGYGFKLIKLVDKFDSVTYCSKNQFLSRWDALTAAFKVVLNSML